MTTVKKGIINRDLSDPWNNGKKKGTVVYECRGYTYGCISDAGEAVSEDPNGAYPFFEVPRGVVDWES